MQPYDYTVKSPDMFQGYQNALGLAERIQTQDLMRQQKELAIQQAQRAQQQQEQEQQFVQGFFSKPADQRSDDDYARMSMLNKGAAEFYKNVPEERRASDFTEASNVYAALDSGNSDVARSILDRRIEAAKNSGNTRQAQALSDIRQLIELSPESAKDIALTRMVGIDKDKAKTAVDSLLAQRKMPAEVRKSEAEASKEATEAKYSERDILSKLEERGWNTKKLQAEIGNMAEQRKLDLMRIQLSRQDNDLKRQELGLKIQEREQKMADERREKLATVESGASSIDNMLNTVDRLLNNKALNSVLGSFEGSKFYPQQLVGSLPLTASGDERADAQALIETLGSQAFISQIPAMKGSGALSDAEGKKLQSALTNLSREQSEGQFRENLKEAQRLALKARKTLEGRYGVKAGIPDTPAAVPNATDINTLLNKYK